MTVAMTKTGEGASIMNVQDALRSLTTACQSKVAFRAGLRADGCDVAIEGAFVGLDAKTMMCRVPPNANGTPVFDSGDEINVEFVLLGGRYAFETLVLRHAKTDSSDLIRLALPDTVFTVEQRRNPRRAFQKPGTVAIYGMSPAESWDFTGSLLNLSVNGLACRMQRSEADQILGYQRIGVAFQVGPKSDEFELHARVASVTEASSSDLAIVGLEFDENATDQASRTALRDALEGHWPEGVDNG